MRELKQFVELLTRHNLDVRHIKSGHNGIFKNGVKIYAFANSPKNEHEAVDNNIKDLCKMGYLPPLVWRGKKYGKKRRNRLD